MITIRRPVADDAPRLADINRESWRESYAHLLSERFLTELPDRTEMFRGAIERAPQLVVAELDGEVVGYALAGPGGDGAPRDWELRHLYQYARVHGSGTGQALLDAAVGDRPAFLWVADGNPRALAFYRRNGFRADGEQMIYPDWEDLVGIRMVR